MNLPKDYQSKMQEMLGEEYLQYLDSFNHSYGQTLRVNQLKMEPADFIRRFLLSGQVSWCNTGFYYEGEQKLSAHPYYYAGVYYLQEPSAMAPAAFLPVEPGDRVLDLCAAPGGKSTALAAKLQGEGILISNDISASRCKPLLKNMEMAGVSNAVITCESPEKLADRFFGYFDKVLVDAPCSGEGMFRRDERAIQEWSPEHVKTCAVRQLAILESASQALREGGILVYSTCTFSPEENEGVISAFLEEHCDFALVDCGVSFGRPGTIPQTRRILPLDGGEGHFVAKLQRISENGDAPAPYSYQKPSKEARACCELIYREAPKGAMEQIGDNLLLLPNGLPQMKGLGVLRAGVLLGTFQKRIEPAHAAFMAAKPQELRVVLELSHSDPRIAAFLHGEELEAPDSYKGYTGVAVDGIVTGFGKCSGGRLKNRYPKGLRNHGTAFMQDI